MGYSLFFSSFSYSFNKVIYIIQTVRFYEVGEHGVKKSEAKAKFDHRAAVLACAFTPDGQKGFSGGLDTSVRE